MHGIGKLVIRGELNGLAHSAASIWQLSDVNCMCTCAHVPLEVPIQRLAKQNSVACTVTVVRGSKAWEKGRLRTRLGGAGGCCQTGAPRRW